MFNLKSPHSPLATFHCLTPIPLLGSLASIALISAPVQAQKALYLAYPPNNHKTIANQIFLIGTAPVKGTVLVNGEPISRSPAGHFAPSFPLKVGANRFVLRYGKQELTVTITRLSTEPEIPAGVAFAKNSLTPAVDVARLPDEWICFGAIAPANARVSVQLAGQTIPLSSPVQKVELPDNAAVLTQKNQPVPRAATGYYKGCTRTVLLGDLGKPEFQLTMAGQTISQTSSGSIRILSPTQLEVAEVIAENGAARTGPSTDYSRLTPLPKGTQALVTGYEGEWVRLDYGAWINRKEVQIQKSTALPTSLIRSIKARQVDGWTEVVFPLQVPVPLSVQQGDRTFTLTLYNTTAQTDIIKLDDDPLIERLDWQQTVPGQIQYTFKLKTSQQWGYKLRYEGTSLVLSLRHPPAGVRSQKPGARSQKGLGARNWGLKVRDARSSIIQDPEFKPQNSSTRPPIHSSPPSPRTPPSLSLANTTILLDPGHGGPEDPGAVGPTGLQEKTVVLTISKLLREQLIQRGAKVVMTREKDEDVSLQDRIALINKTQPTLALSLHYNALPDNGDAIRTKGISTFWYQTQAHSLAVFLHNYLVKTLKRPSYGIFWNNLALTRPAVAPTVLIELGFLINPVEYEWIVNPKEQQRLAIALADGIAEWLRLSQSR
jgi:N-acetylmuramoyl-L-alanine amidase